MFRKNLNYNNYTFHHMLLTHQKLHSHESLTNAVLCKSIFFLWFTETLLFPRIYHLWQGKNCQRIYSFSFSSCIEYELRFKRAQPLPSDTHMWYDFRFPILTISPTCSKTADTKIPQINKSQLYKLTFR